MNKRKYFILGTLILLCTSMAYSQSPSPAEIVQKTGIQGGLIVHVGCGDGRLTAGLRVNDRYVVQGLDTDPANVRKAQQHIRSLGIYGPVTAKTFDGKHPPYAANLCFVSPLPLPADTIVDRVSKLYFITFDNLHSEFLVLILVLASCCTGQSNRTLRGVNQCNGKI